MTYDEFLSEWNNGDTTVAVHTSGSTGAPKALRVEKTRMEASARMTLRFLGLHEGDTALLCLPLDFIAGKMMAVRAAVGKLRLIAVEPSGHPLATLADDLHIHFAAMVPLQVWNSLGTPEEKQRLEHIDHLIIGGGAIDPALEESLRTMPGNVWSTYGMTETLSHIAMRRVNGPEASPWYTPLPGVTVSSTPDSRLVINAPHLCRKELTTNDIVQFDPHRHRFHILGRSDNVICSGGIKIQAEEAERLLRPHLPCPFLITKVPDHLLGQAAVLLYEGTPPPDLNDLCRTILPPHWAPRHIISVNRLPLTANGKPARAEAERMARETIR